MNKTLPKEFYNSVTQAAKLYEKNLEGNEVTFLTSSYKKNKNLDFYTLEFKAENFSHLVGITPKGNRNCEMLFGDCLNNSLNSTSYKLTHRIGTVRLKLAVINNLTNISCDCMEKNIMIYFKLNTKKITLGTGGTPIVPLSPKAINII